MNTIKLSATSRYVRRSSRWSELKRYVYEWRRRAISRCELTSLNDRDLSDLGLTRGAAEFEGSKPFWRG
jgi:uncharacterized protein YjiS (DUF1127 family)